MSSLNYHNYAGFFIAYISTHTDWYSIIAKSTPPMPPLIAVRGSEGSEGRLKPLFIAVRGSEGRLKLPLIAVRGSEGRLNPP